MAVLRTLSLPSRALFIALYCAIRVWDQPSSPKWTSTSVRRSCLLLRLLLLRTLQLSSARSRVPKWFPQPRVTTALFPCQATLVHGVAFADIVYRFLAQISLLQRCLLQLHLFHSRFQTILLWLKKLPWNRMCRPLRSLLRPRPLPLRRRGCLAQLCLCFPSRFLVSDLTQSCRLVRP